MIFQVMLKTYRDGEKAILGDLYEIFMIMLYNFQLVLELVVIVMDL